MHLSRGHRLKVTQGKQVTKVRIGGARRIFFVRLVSQGLLEVSGEENSRFEPAKRRPRSRRAYPIRGVRINKVVIASAVCRPMPACRGTARLAFSKSLLCHPVTTVITSVRA